MGAIASSRAFSVPVMSHFAALNICQTWNILNARLISHAWGVRHPLICPLFFASLSKRSPLYFVDWARGKTFLPYFWQRPFRMRGNLVLILNGLLPSVSCIPSPRRGNVGEGWRWRRRRRKRKVGGNLKRKSSVGTMGLVQMKTLL